MSDPTQVQTPPTTGPVDPYAAFGGRLAEPSAAPTDPYAAFGGKIEPAPPVPTSQPPSATGGQPGQLIPSDAKITAQAPSFLDRVKAVFESGNPNYSGNTAPVSTPQLITPEAFMTPNEQAQHPIATGVGEFAGGLTTPQGVALQAVSGGLGAAESLAGLPKAAKILPQLASAGFSAQQVLSGFKSIPQLRVAWGNGDVNEVEHLLTHMTLEMAAAAYGGQHAVTGKPAEPLVPGVDEAIKDYTKGAIDNTIKVPQAIAEGVKNTAGNAVGKAVEGIQEQIGTGGNMLENVRRASKPAKGEAADYQKSLNAAEPQLREVFKDNPKVDSPQAMVGAIQKHINTQETALRDQARNLQGPNGRPADESVMAGTHDAVDQALDDFFKEKAGAYKPEEIQAAKDAILYRIRQDIPGAPGQFRDPSLFEGENLRRQLGDETAPIFGTNNAVPSAVKDAKIVAAKVLRGKIDQKYDDLGVQGVKEWRKQEAPLIDVKDQLEKAFQKATDMGDWSLIKSAIKSAGWGVLGSVAGPHGTIAGEGLGILKDYINDRATNPNRLIERAAKKANQNTTPTGAVIPTPSSSAPTVPTSVPADLKPEVKVQEPAAPASTAKSVVPQAFENVLKEAGVIPLAIQKGDPALGLKDLVMFQDPETKTSLALPIDKVTTENIKSQIEKSRAKFKQTPQSNPPI